MTRTPIGRDAVMRRLHPLPVCVLLRAPASTGKRTTVEHVAATEGVSSWDLRLFPPRRSEPARARRSRPGSRWSAPPSAADRPREDPLSAADVAELRAWAAVPARTPAGKLAIVRLDHVRRFDAVRAGEPWTASEAVQHALLKLLEEPPAYRDGTPALRFALLAAGPIGAGGVLPTVASRCSRITAGLLSDEHVAEVLYQTSDLDEVGARSAAALGGGRVSPAMARRGDALRAREAVVGVVNDLYQGDLRALAERTKAWSELDTEMLLIACHEVITGQFRCFSSGLALRPRHATQVLRAVAEVRGAAPRLVLGRLAELAA